VDVPKLQKLAKDQGFLIDGGYGKIKGTTFRISNTGRRDRGDDGAALRGHGQRDEAALRR
jgi:aspartate aminotransferase-like enzyme